MEKGFIHRLPCTRENSRPRKRGTLRHNILTVRLTLSNASQADEAAVLGFHIQEVRNQKRRGKMLGTA
ncbi:hypothetical protein SKAU_G00252870 [Synaphobranchus kaupii]|uniref:Uncharacterized protein n=1 Tax=Synaphobranchus kaupii TaxID=118154 RepID=A0A9Q1F367_SYNKA|nr:hypothetical protein SKAU_G00252870 [Synaphobranchus kaupii]